VSLKLDFPRKWVIRAHLRFRGGLEDITLVWSQGTIDMTLELVQLSKWTKDFNTRLDICILISLLLKQIFKQDVGHNVSTCWHGSVCPDYVPCLTRALSI